MVMSDRIALLRSGELEQVASPREIYNRPATAYTARFIGHANLLKADIHQGKATCWTLQWPTSLPDGTSLFSLRPECIRSANAGSQASGATVRFWAKLHDRVFHGATQLLRIESDGGLILTVRTATGDLREGTLEFEFSVADIVPVRVSEERA
jgi:ABC-type Fe3+/spermidine/putrescine transport system ATPase subunit